MRKKVLVAPLDWGLGHATRCIPIINGLLTQGHEVLIATSGLAMPLLKQEFTQLTFVELPSYKVSYSSKLPLMIKLFFQTPFFLWIIRKEKRVMEQVVKHFKIDVIISDNRYGCYSQNAKSIFITHQLTILMPGSLTWLEGIVNFFNQQTIRNFDECWVPDFPNDNLTGKLTKAKNLPVKFIGMLSRFEKGKYSIVKQYDLLVLLSGPEPQRSIFEKLVIQQVRKYDGNVLVVRGLPGEEAPDHSFNGSEKVTIINHLPTSALQQAIESSALVLARSGYTTVMDLFFLEKKAIFVPTPGQTEQEYLAIQLKEKGIADFINQHQFDLTRLMSSSTHYSGFSFKRVQHNYLQECLLNL